MAALVSALICVLALVGILTLSVYQSVTVRVCFNWFIDASWGGTLAMAGAACVRTHKLHPYTFGQNVANK